MPEQRDDTPQQHQHRPRNQRGGGRGRGRRRQASTAQAPSDAPSDVPVPSSSESHPHRPSRRARFKPTLTEAPAAQTSSDTIPSTETRKPKPQTRRASPPGDDLTSTLTHALRTPPYPDCPICFNPIRPEQSTWSCSPSVSASFAPTPTNVQTESEEKTWCWNTFHLKCIRAWAEKSVKELEEAWRARGESKPGEWRCPGCRTTRQAVPQTYICFCLRMRHPAPPRIATPHSCAQPCSRPRPGCRHACPLPCHPGPCPPCVVTIQVPCFCGKEKHSAKCQVGLGTTSSSFSCTQPCLKQLTCSNPDHICREACHQGPCPPCPEREEVQCWCGRETKHVACGEAKPEDATQCVVEDDGSQRTWMGSYGCGHPCERPFACSHHSCSKLCHPPSLTPPPCPFDPERVLSCACGRRHVARSSDELAGGSPQTSLLLPSRSSCTSPLPTCTSPCSKPLPCGHLCKATCHWDPCPPCTETVERTCRCGATKHKSPCNDPLLVPHSTSINNDTPASETVLCNKPCQALRVCGRHQCGRICCPLASQRGPTKSSKKHDLAQLDLDAQLYLDLSMRALHECDVPCGRVLSCGNHSCQERDHKGPCAMCPRGVFEELVCLCGRTVLEPPIQCGTVLKCVYPCARPPPVCGHPHVSHACHEGVVVAGTDTADEGLGLGMREEGQDACPPCPFLTEKLCACGKKRVGNVRCSQERVSCGSACGKLSACGFHHCERLCHADACGTCTAICGKSRKSCLPAHHPCTQTCHAPTACPETEPCLAPVTLTCPCGHLRSTIPCSGTKLTLACTGECEIKKRNARLAEALGISEEKRDAKGSKVAWPAELVGSARVMGPKFVGVVEKAFADFVHSDRRTHVLPHMPLERRKFVHDLASVYRMDTVMVDQEPHRSVQLIRRIDTRVPTPLVSQHMASTMGRLVELRSVAGSKAVSAGAASGSGHASAGGASGRWSVVAKSTAGASRSGSTTPAGVPSPAGDVVSGLGRSSAGAWVSPSVQALRARERAEGQSQVPSGDSGGQDVPDDWEEDV